MPRSGAGGEQRVLGALDVDLHPRPVAQLVVVEPA